MFSEPSHTKSSDRENDAVIKEPQMTQQEIINRANVERLSDKQRECMRLVVMRKSSKQIARELGISKPTADQRIAAARQILGVSNRDEAAVIFASVTELYDRVIYDSGHVPISSPTVDMSFHEVQQGSGLRLEEPASIPFSGGFEHQGIAKSHFSWSTFEDAGAVSRLLIILGLTTGILVLVMVGLSVAQSISGLLAAY